MDVKAAFTALILRNHGGAAESAILNKDKAGDSVLSGPHPHRCSMVRLLILIVTDGSYQQMPDGEIKEQIPHGSSLVLLLDLVKWGADHKLAHWEALIC